MSQVQGPIPPPVNPPDPLGVPGEKVITREPLFGEIDLDNAVFNKKELVRQVEEDRLSIGLYRAQERARRLRYTTDELEARGIEQLVNRMGDDEILQEYSAAFRNLNKLIQPIPLSRGEEEVARITRELEIAAERYQAPEFIMDVVAGMGFSLEEIGVAGWQVAGAFAVASSKNRLLRDVFGVNVAEEMTQIAEEYRERVLSGESGELGSFIQQMNVRNRRNSWGVGLGKLFFNAVPNIGLGMRSTFVARQAFNGLMGVYSTYSAGLGIEKYRRETMERGEVPNAATAILVGLGYGAAEFVSERLDIAFPWQRLTTTGGMKIAEHILRREPGKATTFFVNTLGFDVVGGVEEIVAGEMQGIVDLMAIGENDRNWSNRFTEFGLGAAGSRIASTGLSIASRDFRRMMQGEDTPLHAAGVPQELVESLREYLESEQGRASAVAQAITTFSSPPAPLPAGVATAAKREVFVPEKVDRKKALAEYRHSLEVSGINVDVTELPEDQLTPAQQKLIDSWQKRGITVIPLIANQTNPLPAYATSQRGVIVTEVTPNAKVNEVITEIGFIAHEFGHELRFIDPVAYEKFWNAAAGPIMAAGNRYVRMAIDQGLVSSLGLDSVDQIIDEGGALLFQELIEKTGLVSVLAQEELGVIQSIKDMMRRTLTKLGLRGVAVKAVYDAVQAVAAQEAYRPVQPAADVVAGIQPPRFAIRRRGDDELVKELDRVARLALWLGQKLEQRQTEFDTLKWEVANFDKIYALHNKKRRADIIAASTTVQLRNALKVAMNETLREQAAAIKVNTEKVLAITKARYEAKFSKIEQARKRRQYEIDRLKHLAIGIVRKYAPIESQGDFIEAINKIKYGRDLSRVIRRVQSEIQKANRKKSISQFLKIMKLFSKHRGRMRDKYTEMVKNLVTKPDGTSIDLKTIPYSQLNRITNQIRAIIALNLLENKVERDIYKEEVKNTADIIAAESAILQRNGRAVVAKYVVDDPSRRNLIVNTITRKIIQFAIPGHFKPQTQGEFAWGNNSAGLKLFYYDRQADGDRRLADNRSDNKYFRAGLEAQGYRHGTMELAMLSQFYSDAHGRAYNSANMHNLFKVKPTYHTVELTGKRTITLTSAERISFMGNSLDNETYPLLTNGKTPSILRRTGETFTFNKADIANIWKSATKEEINLTWSLYNRYNGSMGNRMSMWSLDKYGIDISNHRYWPRFREPDPKPKSSRWDDHELERMDLTRLRQQSEKRPFFIGDAFFDYHNHSWQISSLTNMQKGIDFARDVLAQKNVQENLAHHSKVETRRYFENLLEHMTREGMGVPQMFGDAYISSITGRLRTNVIRGLLGWNPTVIMYQPLALVNAATTDLAVGDIIASIGMGYMFDANVDKIIDDGDAYLAHRIESSGIGFFSDSDSGQQQVAGFRGPGYILMAPISYADKIAIRAIFGAYKIAIKRSNPNLTEDELNVQALAKTNRNVKETQPTFDTMHQSGIAREAAEKPLNALFTMFTSPFNANLQLMARASMRFLRDPGTEPKKQLAKTLFAVLGVNAMGVTLVRMMVSEFLKLLGAEREDDRKFWIRYLDELTAQTVSSAYLLGGVANITNRLFGRRIPPRGGFSPVLDVGWDTASGGAIATHEASKKMLNAVFGTKFEVDDNQLLYNFELAAEGAAALSGLPVAPWRIIKRVRKRKKKVGASEGTLRGEVL